MKIIIKTKNLELTPNLQNFIEEKIGSVKKFMDILKTDTPEGLKTLAEVFVEVEKETTHHKKGEVFLVKTQIILPGKSLSAVYRADEVSKAVVGAKKELRAEIEKYKFKKADKSRREQRKAKGKI